MSFLNRFILEIALQFSFSYKPAEVTASTNVMHRRLEQLIKRFQYHQAKVVFEMFKFLGQFSWKRPCKSSIWGEEIRRPR